MRTMHFVAATAIAFGIAAALSAPAYAEPTIDDLNGEQIDEIFTKEVRERGLRISANEAIDLAHSTCDVLSRGGSAASALHHIKNATDWTKDKDITSFGSLALRAYCPTSAPQ